MKFDPPKLSSSYAANRLGKTIYQIVFDLAPQKVIEFGVLHGYSLVCIAKALQHLGRGGYVIGYDLWEDYPFNHGNMNEVKRILKKYEIENVVILKKLDINLWLKSPEEFDLLHLDVSIEGEILQRVVD
ncbi:MAG: hypothetical protein QG657_820, partial [Acidobacteriota bacterium]|nr:hypothetical protein [Acidobacteriota bacterium]